MSLFLCCSKLTPPDNYTKPPTKLECKESFLLKWKESEDARSGKSMQDLNEAIDADHLWRGLYNRKYFDKTTPQF
jgi:hypothetical protein